MSGEVIAATAAGVGAASAAFVIDQNLAMASAGGLAMFLAVSVAIPLQTRMFFGIGSFILGYIAGMLLISYGDLSIYATITAFVASALGSSVFGSLHSWGNGGPTPRWILFITKFLPFGLKKSDRNE